MATVEESQPSAEAEILRAASTVPKTRRFDTERAVDLILGRTEQDHQHELQLASYLLLLWIRFPDLHDFLGHYAAQAVMRINMQSDSEETELSRAQERRFGKQVWPFHALPPHVLDGFLWNPPQRLLKLMSIAELLAVATHAEPRLLVRNVLELLVREDIFSMGPEFWGKRTPTPSGAVKTQFGELWGEASPSLLLQYSLWRSTFDPSRRLAEFNLDRADEMDGPKAICIWKPEMPAVRCLTTDLLSNFFEKPWRGGDGDPHGLRSGLIRYKLTIDQLLSQAHRRGTYERFNCIKFELTDLPKCVDKIVEEEASTLSELEFTSKQKMIIKTVAPDSEPPRQ